MTLTRRAAVMEAQVDVLEGKQKVLARFRDGLARIREAAGPRGSDRRDDRRSATAAAAPGRGIRRGRGGHHRPPSGG